MGNVIFQHEFGNYTYNSMELTQQSAEKLKNIGRLLASDLNSEITDEAMNYARSNDCVYFKNTYKDTLALYMESWLNLYEGDGSPSSRQRVSNRGRSLDLSEFDPLDTNAYDVTD
jgi:hypothetical protein